MAFKLRRPASKDRSKALNPEPDAEKKPLYINYDREGNRIGDDGFPLTPCRKRLHLLLNLCFVWGIICILGTIACAVGGFAQGQTYTDWELHTVGGNMINGYPVATLLRLEGLLCLFTAVFAIFIHIKGFHWFYDGGSLLPVATVMGIMGLLSAAYPLVLLLLIGLPDIAGPLSLVLLLFLVLAMYQVAAEKPTLGRVKVARTEKR